MRLPMTGYRVPKRVLAVALSVCLAEALVPTAGTASTPVTARELALAGTGTTAARGVEALWANPANLAGVDRPGFSIVLLSAAGGLSNNSFTIGQYNRFARPGTELSDSDKDEILGSIPGEQFQVVARAGANALGLTIGPFGFAVTPRILGSISVAKDYSDLLLNGNVLNRTYTFDGTSGEALAFFETSFSYGRGASWIPLGGARWGMSFKLIRGAACFEVLESKGRVVTYPSKAAGEGLVKVRFSGSTEEGEKGEDDSEYTSSGGQGIGFDFGIAGEISPKWSTALVIRDLGSHITWDEGTVKEYAYRADSLTAENADDEDLIVDEEYEHSVGSFKMPLSTTLHLEFTRRTPRLLLSAAYDQAFRTFAGLSTTPRLSAGMEFWGRGWLPIRGSLSTGGGMGVCAGAGLGTHLGGLRFDLAGFRRGIKPGGAKGAFLALTSYLRF